MTSRVVAVLMLRVNSMAQSITLNHQTTMNVVLYTFVGDYLEIFRSLLAWREGLTYYSRHNFNKMYLDTFLRIYYP